MYEHIVRNAHRYRKPFDKYVCIYIYIYICTRTAVDETLTRRRRLVDETLKDLHTSWEYLGPPPLGTHYLQVCASYVCLLVSRGPLLRGPLKITTDTVVFAFRGLLGLQGGPARLLRVSTEVRIYIYIYIYVYTHVLLSLLLLLLLLYLSLLILLCIYLSLSIHIYIERER